MKQTITKTATSYEIKITFKDEEWTKYLPPKTTVDQATWLQSGASQLFDDQSLKLFLQVSQQTKEPLFFDPIATVNHISTEAITMTIKFTIGVITLPPVAQAWPASFKPQQLTKHQINNELEEICIDHSQPLARETKISPTSIIFITMKSTIKGQLIPEWSHKNFKVDLAHFPFLPELKTFILQMKIGEQKVTHITFSPDHKNPHLQRQTAQFTITVDRGYHREQLTTLTNPLIAQLGIAGVNNHQQLTAYITKTLKAAIEQQNIQTFGTKFLTNMSELVHFSIPDQLIDQVAQQIKRHDQLAKKHLTTNLKHDILAMQKIKHQMLIRALGKKLAIKLPTWAEIQEAYRDFASLENKPIATIEEMISPAKMMVIIHNKQVMYAMMKKFLAQKK